MQTLRTVRQSQQQAVTSEKPTRKSSENATRIPLSKKCKLDIKRKHLRAAIPECLAVNSYAVNIQLQIDDEKLPDLYKCTIKKHVNNKTNCVSYRLQGTGIYNHLRGLYMRGFSCGEEPGVVVLVASSQAATDLSYSGLPDVGDVRREPKTKTRTAANDAADSDAQPRQQRQRRQQQRPRQRLKRHREELDGEDRESDRSRDVKIKVEATDPAVPGLSSRKLGFYPAQQSQQPQPHLQQLHHRIQPFHDYHNPLPQLQLPYNEHDQQQLRSHPIHVFEPSPNPGYIEGRAGIRSHALSGRSDGSAALFYRGPSHEEAASTLDAAGVEVDFAGAIVDAERHTAQAGRGPGPRSSLDPFDQHAPSRGPGPRSSLDPFDQHAPSRGPGPRSSLDPFDQHAPSRRPGPRSSLDPFDQHAPSRGPEPRSSLDPFDQHAPSRGPGLRSSLDPFEQHAPSRGPGLRSSLDPFDQHAFGTGRMGFVGFGSVRALGDGGGSLLSNMAQGQASYLSGPGLLGPDASVCSMPSAAQLSVMTRGEIDNVGLPNTARALPYGFHQQRDLLQDRPLSSSFSPAQLLVLTGQPYLPRLATVQPPSQVTSGWGVLQPDCDYASPREHLVWNHLNGVF